MIALNDYGSGEGAGRVYGGSGYGDGNGSADLSHGAGGGRYGGSGVGVGGCGGGGDRGSGFGDGPIQFELPPAHAELHSGDGIGDGAPRQGSLPPPPVHATDKEE